MRTKKLFCKCGAKIKVKEYPYCGECLRREYDKGRLNKLKNKTMEDETKEIPENEEAEEGDEETKE